MFRRLLVALAGLAVTAVATAPACFAQPSPGQVVITDYSTLANQWTTDPP